MHGYLRWARRSEAAVRRFEQAIETARKLCADSKEVRDRLVEMGRVKMLLTGGSKDQKKDADAKLDLASDLSDHSLPIGVGHAGLSSVSHPLAPVYR
jgi:hypothetical protein